MDGDDATLPDSKAARTDPVPRVDAAIDGRYALGTVLGRGGMGEARRSRSW